MHRERSTILFKGTKQLEYSPYYYYPCLTYKINYDFKK